jgi:hypothetical protein
MRVWVWRGGRFLRSSAHNGYVMSAPVLQGFMGAKGVHAGEAHSGPGAYMLRETLDRH